MNATDGDVPPDRLWKRLLWFVGLWVLGVAVLGAIAYLIRFWLM